MPGDLPINLMVSLCVFWIESQDLFPGKTHYFKFHSFFIYENFLSKENMASRNSNHDNPRQFFNSLLALSHSTFPQSLRGLYQEFESFERETSLSKPVRHCLLEVLTCFIGIGELFSHSKKSPFPKRVFSVNRFTIQIAYKLVLLYEKHKSSSIHSSNSPLLNKITKFTSEKLSLFDSRLNFSTEEDPLWVFLAISLTVLPGHFTQSNIQEQFKEKHSPDFFSLFIGMEISPEALTPAISSTELTGHVYFVNVFRLVLKKELELVYEYLCELAFPFESFLLEVYFTFGASLFGSETLWRLWNMVFIEKQMNEQTSPSNLLICSVVQLFKLGASKLEEVRSIKEVMAIVKSQAHFPFLLPSFVSSTLSLYQKYFIEDSSRSSSGFLDDLVESAANFFKIKEKAPNFAAEIQKVARQVSMASMDMKSYYKSLYNISAAPKEEKNIQASIESIQKTEKSTLNTKNILSFLKKIKCDNEKNSIYYSNHLKNYAIKLPKMNPVAVCFSFQPDNYQLQEGGNMVIEFSSERQVMTYQMEYAKTNEFKWEIMNVKDAFVSVKISSIFPLMRAKIIDESQNFVDFSEVSNISEALIDFMQFQCQTVTQRAIEFKDKKLNQSLRVIMTFIVFSKTSARMMKQDLCFSVDGVNLTSPLVYHPIVHSVGSFLRFPSNF